MQHYVYQFLNEIGQFHVLLFLGICVISLTRPCHPIASYTSSWTIFTSIWAPLLLNGTIFFLRIIACLKLAVALLRTMIKSRQFTKMNTKNINDLDKSSLDLNLKQVNNKCIICLDDITVDHIISKDSNSINYQRYLPQCYGSDDSHIVLKCNHIFHYNCFKQWYMSSACCPYCRNVIN